MEKTTVKKETRIDFENAIKICKDRGVKKSYISIAEETGYGVTGILKIRKKAPQVITMLYHFLKENDLKWEDLVKEIE